MLDLEILNNFFSFNFIKEKNIIINKGFTRNALINSSFKGEVFFKPHFFFNFEAIPAVINVKKLFIIIQKKYFSEESETSEIINKVNGILNFKNNFDGRVVFENKAVLFQNFKIGKNSPIFFNARILNYGKKGKIQFNLSKNIQIKGNPSKELNITGSITPFSSKVTFEKILLDREIFTLKKIKKYEDEFKNKVINKTLGNIFDQSKINIFLNNFVN